MGRLKEIYTPGSERPDIIERAERRGITAKGLWHSLQSHWVTREQTDRTGDGVLEGSVELETLRKLEEMERRGLI